MEILKKIIGQPKGHETNLKRLLLTKFDTSDSQVTADSPLNKTEITNPYT